MSPVYVRSQRGRHRSEVSRSERVKQVRELKANGLNGAEIARKLGLGHAYVYSVLSDPTGKIERERKRQYGKDCLGCGARTYGSDGYTAAPEYCAKCAPAAYAKWSKETVIAAIRRFAERHGKPPAATDFNPSRAQSRGQVERAAQFFTDGDYPYATTVLYVFGDWNSAITAAGFTPRTSSRKRSAA